MKKKSICFISETGQGDRPVRDPSVRYRAFHPSELLMEAGHICNIFSSQQFFLSPSLDYDVYIFHRPSVARKTFCEIIDTLKKLKKCIIADYDDLIFGDVEIALNSSAVKNKTLEEEKATEVFSNNLEAMLLFDKVITSTEALAEFVRKYNPHAEVTVVGNITSNSLLHYHEKLGTHLRKRDNTSIAYFAGTKSHNHDFPIVEKVIHRILSESKKSTLFIIGPVLLPKSISHLPNVKTSSVVNYLRLPGLMSKFSTVIAPLETTPFNKCKSRVKYIEAALSGCRLVATPIPDMVAIGRNRLVLAENDNEWYEGISAHLEEDERIIFAKRNFDHLKNLQNIDKLMLIGGLK